MDQTLQRDSMAVELGCICAALDGASALASILDFNVHTKMGEEPCGRPALFRQIVESIGEVFWMMDPATGRAAYVSPAFEQIWGVSCESMYADPLVWNRSIHPDDRAQAVAAFGEMVSGNPIMNEYRIIRPDGTVRFIRDRGFPVRDAAGRVIRIAGVAEDVTRYKESQAALARIESRYRRLVESDVIGVFNGDETGRILAANETFLKMFGYTPDDLAQNRVRWDRMTAPGWEHINTRISRELRETGRSAPLETVRLRKDGTGVPVIMGIAAIDAEPGTAIGFVLDIARLKVAEEELRRSEEKFRQFGENVHQVFWLYSLETFEVLYVNPAYEKVWQRSLASVYANPRAWLDAIHPDDRASLEAMFHRESKEEILEHEYRIVQPSGAIRWIRSITFPIRDAERRVIRLGGVAEDITERKQYQMSLEHQASHDQLTDLPNRRMLARELDTAIARRKARGGLLAVFYIDLDRFKLVNDSLGHGAGDELLREVSARLREVTRSSDLLARVGGDEFILIAPDFENKEEVSHFGHRLLDSLRPAFRIAGRELFIGASVGVSLCPQDGQTSDVLQRSADAALQDAKRKGSARVSFFSERFAQEAADRLAMETRLRQALVRHEFRLVYQPQFAGCGTQLAGFEALIRWHPPGSEPVPPDRFIPVAEENGLIVPIGYWVVSEACRAAAEWQTRGYAGIAVAVNVSARQFADADLIPQVLAALKSSGLPPGLLQLEITESVFIADLRESARRLTALRQLGISVALDDFGTGYASLSYLRHLPIDVMKIDRSFLEDTGAKESGEAVLRCVIDLAHALGIRVLAEGVETPDQRDLLYRLGCDAMQGFLLGTPASM